MAIITVEGHSRMTAHVVVGGRREIEVLVGSGELSGLFIVCEQSIVGGFGTDSRTDVSDL
jgi:hypothetical protein